MRRRPAALAVAAVLVGGLAACGAESGAPSLTWYINPDDGGQAEIASRCTEQADGAYTISTELLPLEAADQREQLSRRLAANDDSIDLMSLDPIYIPEFAEADWLAPVPDDVGEAVTSDVVQGALDFSTWRDELVVAPFWANTQLLWYRESVAEEAGLDPANEPVTWDQLITVAEEQDKVLSLHGVRAEAYTVWINALVMSAGGEVLANPEADAEDLQIDLENDAGRAAAEIISTIASEGLGGPGLPNQDEEAAMLQFRGDDGSFMVNWPFVYAATVAGVEDGSIDQAVLDDIAWAAYPQVGDQDSRPPLGGIGLGVGANSQHVEEAYDAVECIVTPENQAYYFVSNGNPPASSAAYDDPEVQDTFPMADVIEQSLENAGSRPQSPFYNEVSTGLQNTWHPPTQVDPQATPSEAEEFITAVLRGERLL